MYFDASIMFATMALHPAVALIAKGLIALSFLFALMRLIKGPNLVDRVVALDLISGIILAYTLFHAIVQADMNFMSVSLAIAVVAFLGTVAIARYLEHRALNKKNIEHEEH